VISNHVEVNIELRGGGIFLEDFAGMPASENDALNFILF
jgi:hypothetical protein